MSEVRQPLPSKLARYLKTHAGDLGKIEIGGRLIADDQPAFIVAEAASNHMCDMGLAKQMIDGAARAGADAIKFQTYKAEKLVTANAIAFWGQEKTTQLEYYRRLDRFGRREYEVLFAYAWEQGIIPFSSPFDQESTSMLAEIGMPAFKIASCDIPDVRHLRQVAGYGKPIILSTGASTVAEIDRALDVIFDQGNHQLILLACTLSYPTQYEDANFKRIKTLKERYPGIIIGISDHTPPDPNMVIPAVAVATGAKLVEKHFTLDRTMTGSGHFFAVNPDDLEKMVVNIKLAQKIMGSGHLGVARSEKKAWESARRSIVAEVSISKGTLITSAMLGVKRPGGNLPASMIDQLIGKRATRDIAVDMPLSLEMVE